MPTQWAVFDLSAQCYIVLQQHAERGSSETSEERCGQGYAHGGMDSQLWLCCLLIFTLHVASTESCHPGCRCEVESFGLFDSFSLTKVDCSRVGPHITPIPIPLDTSYLDLSSNHMETLTDSMLTGPGYTTLVSLDLSNNKLTRVHSKTFSKLRYLESLDLSSNCLEVLSDGCFSGLPLTEVDLSNNRLQEFRLDIFTSKGHGKPIHLDLSNNVLTAVSRNPHSSSPNIQSLSLAGNRLTAVPLLQSVPVRSLNLDGNPIPHIQENAFVGMTELTHLSLSSLPALTSIQPNSFKGLQNLQVLDLSNCPKLKDLKPEVFSGLLSLQELNLSNSGVTALPSKLLNYLPSIRSITLGPNLHCWKSRKQGQFHPHTGRVKSGDTLTCDPAATLL
ncbi:tsukushi-like isoform X1 [Acipenser ruthenus]|nr:tsukushi-like isoform X1 [Acipenser ruthenus]